ncbi:uncharacterized protein LOC124448226 [Xenia sp. Carnegie-2017]|uniref:uncharacterized protein LOC124448226 n=1 Tax=Xenia sp. Carnegie-2017 TaxID=2897299 RepID=UPI001F03DC71|nr:uncharacterized protein LOC124448226 [Xenia sp. Carnegie-2017]
MYLIGENQNAKVYDGKEFFLKIYRHKLNMLSCVIPELDEGNICPACTKIELCSLCSPKLEKDNADNPALKINILYDVACMLVKHLQFVCYKKNLEDPIVDIFQFSIPIFHCYGHVGRCQVKFSPRREEGFGLTDGEMLERLWAYIRKFSRMTKEIRPSQRVDVLSDALLHYGKKTKINLGNLLMARMKRAVDVKETAKLDIEKLCRCFPCEYMFVFAV